MTSRGCDLFTQSDSIVPEAYSIFDGVWIHFSRLTSQGRLSRKGVREGWRLRRWDVDSKRSDVSLIEPGQDMMRLLVHCSDWLA